MSPATYASHGTIPFVSMRLLRAWRHKKPVIHTSTDDVELLLWLLSWDFVCILKKYDDGVDNNPAVPDVDTVLLSRCLLITSAKENTAPGHKQREHSAQCPARQTHCPRYGRSALTYFHWPVCTHGCRRLRVAYLASLLGSCACFKEIWR
jgi:hypothetical protein